jgi:hypothetical protein
VKLRPHPVVVRACLVALLVAATSPAWRLLLLGAVPTEDELLQLRCGVRAAAVAAAPTLARAASGPV